MSSDPFNIFSRATNESALINFLNMKTFRFAIIATVALAVVFRSNAATGPAARKLLAEIPAAIHQQNMVRTEPAPSSQDDPLSVAFHRTFPLAAPPQKKNELKIFADLRYLLWVNGRYVARVPVRLDPQTPQFDVVDLAGNLQPASIPIATASSSILVCLCVAQMK